MNIPSKAINSIIEKEKQRKNVADTSKVWINIKKKLSNDAHEMRRQLLAT